MDMRDAKYVIVALFVLMLVATPSGTPTTHSPVSISPTESVALSHLSGFSYYMEINITGQSGAGTNYQVPLTVNYNTGSSGEANCSTNCQTDFDDIRFTDNDQTTELDYYMENMTASDHADFWIEIADDTSSGTITFYMYYGNASVTTTSDIDDTFIFGEDFTSGSGDLLDSSKWNVVTNYSVDAGETASFGFTGGKWWYNLTAAINTVGVGYIWIANDTAWRWNDTSYHMKQISGWEGNDDYRGYCYPQSQWVRAYDGSANLGFRLMHHGSYDSTYWYHIDAASTENTGAADYVASDTVTNIWLDGDDYEIEWNKTSANGYDLRYNGTDADLDTRTDWESYLYAYIYNGYPQSATAFKGYYDLIRVRKWMGSATEPAVTAIGAGTSVNTAPVAHSGSLTNPTNNGTFDHMFPEAKNYTVNTYMYDVDGYTDIDYAYLRLTRNTGVITWEGKYTESTDTFAEQSTNNTYWTLYTASCSNTSSGNWINLTWVFEITFSSPDFTDRDFHLKVYDDSAANDDETIDNDIYIETDFDFTWSTWTDGSGTADRGNWNNIDGITASGTLYYEDTGIGANGTDLYISCSAVAGSPWSDLDMTFSGAWSMTVDSDDAVGSDTFYLYWVTDGAGSGGTKLNTSTNSDTYISDVINVVYGAVYNSWISVTHLGWYDWNLTLAHDGHLVNGTAGDSVNCTYGPYTDSALTWSDVSVKWQTNPLGVTFSTFGQRYGWIDGAVDSGHGVTAINSTSVSAYNVSIKWDRINLTLTSNYGWSVINYNTTLSCTGGIYAIGGEIWNGTVNWVDQYPSESGYGTVVYNDTSISSITNSDNAVHHYLVTTTASVNWDTANISSSAYFWVQYTYLNAWLVIQTGTFTWEVNATLWTGDYTIRSYINSTADDWGVCSATGQIGDLILGPYDWDDYTTNATLWAEVTVGARAFNWSIWSTADIEVDILHSIHIQDSSFELTDNWVNLAFETNWGNATYYVYDNGSYQGAAFEGWYQVAKSTSVGYHNITIVVNGSQATIDNSSQDYTASDGDYWQLRWYGYTVNPVTLSITDPFAFQNNVSVMIGAIFYTGDLSINYSVYEAGVEITNGWIDVPSSGSYYTVLWSKSSATSVANWSVAFSASGSTNVTLYGYNMVIEGSTYSASYVDQSTHNTFVDSVDAAQVATAEMWQTLGILATIVLAVVVAAVGFKFGQKWTTRRKPRDRTLDAFRQPTSW